MKHLLITTALLTLTPSWVMAATVYPGCAVPTMPAKHNTFFVDPAKGSNKGDGSAAKPWRALSEVLFNGTKLVATSQNPNGPIKPGDVIMLKSGDHGDVKFTGLFNSNFITVMAAPGQTPLLRSLGITSAGKWMFQGLKFMTGVTDDKRGGIIAIGYGDWQGTTQDIVIDNNTVSTIDDTNSWSPLDWKNNTQGTGIWTRQGTKCVSVTSNHVYNTLNGIAMSASDSIVSNNTIDKVFNDGIDITNSNLIIKNNIVSGGTNNPNDGYHADGIQGWSATIGGVVQVNKNVVIDGNQILKFGDDPSKSYMQGITVFDGKWDGLVVQNNIVAVNHMNAVTLMGTQNSKVINNTVIATGPTSFASWIQLRGGKLGTVSSGAIVRNNISTRLSVEGNNMVVDHNIAALSIGIPGQKLVTSGSVGDNNRVVPNIATQFVSFDTKTQSADMRLKAGSVAVGTGNVVGATLQTVTGQTRAKPVNLGAY